MTTAIVEQMLVELGFDTSKFASEADKAIKKHQQLEKAITDTEKSSQKATKAHTELAEKYKSSIEQTAKFGQAIASVTKELTGFFAVIIGSTGLFKLAKFDWTVFSNGIKDSKMSVYTLKKAFSNLYETVKNNAIPTLKGYAEIIGKLARGDFTGAANQARQMINNFSDIAIRVIADANGERKEDIGGFIGESVYRLFHGGKDYFEQNGIQKPVEANVNRGSVAKGSVAKGSVTKGSVAKSSVTKGSVAKSSVTKGSVAKGSVAKSSVTKGSVTKGSVTKGSVTKSKGSFAQELNAAMDRYGIKDEKARASFLSNVDNETGGGKKLTENPNFSLKRWRELASNQKNIRNWLNAHKDNQEAAFKALSQRDKVNIMYNKMIGNKYADDPWKFRGRGGMQLTGRANYQAYADYSGRQDIMSNPDLIATDPRLAADSAAWFFMKRSKAGKQAMAGNITGARKTVNGGTIGMKNYLRLYGQYLQGKGALSNGNLQENALKAQSMIANGQRMQTTSVAHNDNRKHVNVNIQNINVKTSSNTVSGTVVAAMKETKNYMFNQLGVSMT